MLRSREPEKAQAVAPDLALVKDDMDAEEYEMSQHGQEQAPLPDLSLLKDEIDIEEHDLLQHPRVRAALQSRPEVVEQVSQPGSSARPELSVVKVEAGAQELGSVQGAETKSMSQELLVKGEPIAAVEESQAAGASSHSVIVNGIRIKIEEDSILDQTWKLFSSKVVLRDCAAELQQSGRYCQELQVQFPSYSALADHSYARATYCNDRERRKGENIFKCEQCEYTTFRKCNLKYHTLIHTGGKPFKCDRCDYKTGKRYYLKYHKKTHTGEKPFKCDYCNYRAAHRSCLNYHIITHTGEELFKCDQCQYTTFKKCNLKHHTEFHSVEKQFKCDQCEYRTFRKCSLKKHTIIHTVEKPFKCNQCEYISLRKGYLIRHMIIHTGEKPFNVQCANTDVLLK